jgi:hypothetical protein
MNRSRRSCVPRRGQASAAHRLPRLDRRLLLRALEVSVARARSMTCLARRTLRVRSLNDAVERALVHVVQAIKSADRIRVRERAGLRACCRACHAWGSRRASYLPGDSRTNAQHTESGCACDCRKALTHIRTSPTYVAGFGDNEGRYEPRTRLSMRPTSRTSDIGISDHAFQRRTPADPRVRRSLPEGERVVMGAENGVM